MAQIHKCGVCSGEFKTDKEYVEHQCQTGFTPADNGHQDVLTDGQFSRQAETALERGATKKK